MNTFTTKSDSRKTLVITVDCCWIIMTLLSLFALKVAVITFLFCEGLATFGAVGGYFMSVRNIARWNLYFENDVLYLTNMGTKQEYTVWDTPLEDFVFNQTKNQKRHNTGSIMIRDTIFFIDSIQNFTETKQYIETHFHSKQENNI